MRTILASILIALAILLTVTPRLFRQEEIDLHEARVCQQIEVFQRQGALDLPAPLRNTLFSIPQKSFYYGGGFTYGQLRQSIASEVRQGIGGLERTSPFFDYVRYVAESFAQGTRFHGHVTVNQSPQQGYLNLYFVKHARADRAIYHDVPQCSYVGFEDAIFCDSDSIADAFSQIDRIGTNQSVVIAVLEADQKLRVNMLANLDVLRRLLKQNLLIWVIGHEVGHAVHDRDWILAHDAPIHFDGNYNDREERADAFVAGVVLQNNLLGANFTTLLLEFINQTFDQDYRAQYGRTPDFMPGAKNSPLRIRTGRFSRPLLLRAVQVMEQVLKLDPAAMDRADYTVVNGSLGYVHSIQFPERVGQIQSNIVVESDPNRSGLSGPIALGAFILVAGSLTWLIRAERKKQ